VRLPVFVSAPKSFLRRQEAFLGQVEEHLRSKDLEPITLGRSDYDMSAPLEAIRRLMNGCCGLMCIGFRRTYILQGVDRPRSDLGEKEVSRSHVWLTSPYSQIEPAMAYQIGLPILLWREQGVLAEGLFDRGALDLDMPEFDLDKPPVLTERQWYQPLDQWIDRVRSVHRNRGIPPRLW